MARGARAVRAEWSDPNEVAATILAPYFDVTRALFCGHVPERASGPLSKLRRTKFRISDEVADTGRHFAGTTEDGLLIVLAPAIVDLGPESASAIIAHEFGHAADFMYPAGFLPPPRGSGPVRWLGDEPESKELVAWRQYWHDRTEMGRSRDTTPEVENAKDQIEWAADSIAESVVGRSIRYCGECLVQCWNPRAPRRPALLR